MKRFLLFAGDTYYPAGGWGDLAGEFDSIENAEEYTEELDPDWWEIVDTESGKAVKRNFDR